MALCQLQLLLIAALVFNCGLVQGLSSRPSSLPVITTGRRLLKASPASNACVPVSYIEEPASCDLDDQTSVKKVKTKGYHLNGAGSGTQDADDCSLTVSVNVFATDKLATITDPLTGQSCNADGYLTLLVDYYTYCTQTSEYRSTSIRVQLYGSDAASHLLPKRLPSSITGNVKGKLCTASQAPNSNKCSDSPVSVDLDLQLEPLPNSESCSRSFTTTSYDPRCQQTVETRTEGSTTTLLVQLTGGINFSSLDTATYGRTPEPLSHISSSGNSVRAILSKESESKRTIRKPAPAPPSS